MTPGARLEKLVRDTATALMPEKTRKWIRAQQRRYKLQSVPVGSVDFGGLRRLSPISAIFGQDRDLLTIERYYIEEFLKKHSADVKGRCLEMGDPAYIKKFAGDKVSLDSLRASDVGQCAGVVVGLIAVVGLLIMAYLVNLRLDALQYARVVNGVRGYFYGRSGLSVQRELGIRALPRSIHRPRLWEFRYFLAVVSAFGILDSIYLWIAFFLLWPSSFTHTNDTSPLRSSERSGTDTGVSVQLISANAPRARPTDSFAQVTSMPSARWARPRSTRSHRTSGHYADPDRPRQCTSR